MISAPIKPVKLPSVLAGELNGDVDRTLLEPVDAPDYGRLMVANVARAMRALHAFALTFGIVLATTGRGRTLVQQYHAFCGIDARYEPCTYPEYLAAKIFKRHKRWLPVDRALCALRLGPRYPVPNSTYWRKINFPKPDGTAYYRASSATPGNSNHGWWVADDMAERINGRIVSLRASTILWLYEHASRFGFCLETTAEKWHWHWVMGDATPPALIGDEMAQRVKCVEDPNGTVFRLAADRARHIVDGNVSAAMGPLTGPVIPVYKIVLSEYHLDGPIPAGFAATDFASVQP